MADLLVAVASRVVLNGDAADSNFHDPHASSASYGWSTFALLSGVTL